MKMRALYLTKEESMSDDKKEVKELTIEDVKKAAKSAASDNAIHPSKVTIAMLKGQDDRITEWALRQFGGISGVKKYFPVTNKDLAEIKKQKDVAAYINKLEKQLGDNINMEEKILNTIENAISNLKMKPIKIKKRKESSKKLRMAVELMLSDIHFGKKTQTFTLKILHERLEKLTTVFLEQIDLKENQGYDVSEILLPLIGDIIESYTMHGSESSLSCEFGNSRQIQEAIDGIFDYVIMPIAKTGRKIHIPAVAGNHDRTEIKRTFNYPGENYVTWIIYNALKKYCELAKLDNVTFDIPVDSYTTYALFDKHVILYEHLDNVSSPSKPILEGLIKKRERQTEQRISMLRGGHWHEYLCVDRGRIIINESACGQDSFAKVKGYASSAGQVMNFYVDDDNLPNGFLYSYPIYLE